MFIAQFSKRNMDKEEKLVILSESVWISKKTYAIMKQQLAGDHRLHFTIYIE